MLALIDADILVYRVGFTTEDVVEPIAGARMRDSIEGILSSIKATSYRCFLTSQDKSNFRFQVDPTYKAGRSRKPKHYSFLRDFLIENWQAEEIFHEEADDAIGQAHDDESIICTIDKDLDQIAGWHFNFVKGIKYNVSYEEGIRFFYHQLLMGDRTDNISGIKGIGTKTATKILEGTLGLPEYVLYKRVQREYEIAYGSEGQDKLIRNANLLFIRRKNQTQWQVPQDDLVWKTE